jgi:hypothetical protein
MPVVLAGVDLTAVALFGFLLAFLYATKWTLVPLVRALHSALGWVPGIGNLTTRAENAVISAVDGAISTVSGKVVDLYHGTVWAFDQTLDGLRDFAHLSETAISYLWKQGLPRFGRALLVPIHKAIAALQVRIDHAERWIVREPARVEAVVGRATRATIQTARRDISAADHALRADLIRQLDRIEATLRGEITHGVSGAERIAAEGLGALKRAEDAAVADAERIGSMALDEIRTLLNGRDLATIAALIASIPLLRELLRTLEAETGLDNPECRSKVRGICSTNPARWAHLLDLLALEMAWPGLDEFARGVADLAREVADGIVTLVRA